MRTPTSIALALLMSGCGSGSISFHAGGAGAGSATATDDPRASQGGVYASASDPLRIHAPPGALPPDWSPSVRRADPVRADFGPFSITTGAVYTFDDAPLFANPVWLELPRPPVAANEVLVAMLWEPAIADWVFVEHAIDTTQGKLFVKAPHFSTLTTAQIGFTDPAACPAFGVVCGSADSQSGAVDNFGNVVDPSGYIPVVLSIGPAVPAASLSPSMAQAVAMAAHNASAVQQASNTVASAATAQGLVVQYAIDPNAKPIDPNDVLVGGAALATSNAGDAIVPRDGAIDFRQPCAADPCGPGRCEPKGTLAICQCPSGYRARGLSCAAEEPSPGPIHRWTFDALVDGKVPDLVGTAHATLYRGATLQRGSLVLDGVNDHARTPALGVELGAKTLAARLTLANTTQRGGGVVTVQDSAGADAFDAIVFGERVAGQWAAGSEEFQRTVADNGGAVETSTSAVTVVIVYAADRATVIYRDGIPYGVAASPGKAAKRFGAAADIMMGVRHEDQATTTGTAAGTDAYLAGAIDEVRIYDRALDADEVARLHAFWQGRP